jgi:hypothetical protein
MSPEMLAEGADILRCEDWSFTRTLYGQEYARYLVECLTEGTDPLSFEGWYEQEVRGIGANPESWV